MKERVFKRKIYSKMLEWKNSRNGKTALLIKGARRIGKSTIAEQFAKNEYESYILIDFNKAEQKVIDLWNNLNNLNDIFTYLQQQYKVVLHNRKSVIIFDEVQQCPKARQAIKYLVQDGRSKQDRLSALKKIRNISLFRARRHD